MKTKSTSQSAFFNRRVLIGLPVLAGVFLALVRSQTLPRWRRVFCSLFFVAAAVTALGAIGSSRAINTQGGPPYGGAMANKIAPWTPPCSGQLITILDENFDNVTPPALPAGWTATNAIDPDGIFWQTSNTGLPSPPADSLPNAAWVNDPPVVSDKYLDSPGIYATESYFVQLTFRHNFNLESGFDGGVLEISSAYINNGAFTDITDPAVGGSFVTGGYNSTIATGTGSPIAGRQAWSGNSSGFITTVVNLPPELPGAVLRWRMASDNSGSSEGWRVDTANVVWCHFSGTPTPTPPPPPTLAASGHRVQGRHTVDLSWNGANSANIDIYRDGVVIATVPNAGSYKDFIGVRGGNVRYTYKVCEAGTQNCSNEVTVRFGGPPL
jgi:hypothetical protein